MRAPAPKKELIPEGNYRATIYRLIYLGTQEEEYMGQTKESQKIDITWELNDETKVWKEGEEPKPVVISKKYTFSMGDKSNLRPIVEGIVGGMTPAEVADFEMDSLLGKSCLLNITHGVSEKTGGKYHKLSTSLLPKGFEAPIQFNKSFLLDYQRNWDKEKFDSLPDWLKTEMAKAPEYSRLVNMTDEEKSFIESLQNEHNNRTERIKKEIEESDVDDIPF